MRLLLTVFLSQTPLQRPHSAASTGRVPGAPARGRDRPASARQQYSNAAYVDDYDYEPARPIPVTDLSGIYTTDPAPPIVIRTKSIPPADGYSSIAMDARVFSSWSPPVRDQNNRRPKRPKENAVAPTLNGRPTLNERPTSPPHGQTWETSAKAQQPGHAWATPALDSGVRPVYDTGRDEVDVAMDVVRRGAPSQIVSSVRQELQGI